MRHLNNLAGKNCAFYCIFIPNFLKLFFFAALFFLDAFKPLALKLLLQAQDSEIQLGHSLKECHAFFFSLQVAKIRVRVGEWDFSTTSESHPHVERKVTRKIVHPKYNFFTYENDLALVKMDKRISFRYNIIPICLPGNDDLLVGKSEKGHSVFVYRVDYGDL